MASFALQWFLLGCATCLFAEAVVIVWRSRR
jgi:hypothetical protein